MIIAISIIVADILLFFLFIHFSKKYPILNMPFDYQYRVFKRAYRSYRFVREGKKSYHIFSTELVNSYQSMIAKSKSLSEEKLKSANRIMNAVSNHQLLVTRYFNASFGYKEYLEMMKEYDMIAASIAINSTKEKERKSNISLFRKIIIFESLFNAANIDTDATKKARFIRNLLEIEMNTEKIANTNIYKQLKKSRSIAEDGRESKARCEDIAYAINELETIGLIRESKKLQKEIELYKEN